MATFSQIDTTNNNDTYYEIDEMGKTIMLNDNWFVNIHITHDIIPVFTTKCGFQLAYSSK